MRLLHYLIPSSHYVLLALLFFTGLELMTAFQEQIIPFISILFLLLAVGITLVRIEEKDRFRTTQAMLPILAAGGLTGFTLFLPINNWLHGYFILASLLLFWLLKHATKMAYPTWNWTLATIVLFLDTATILGLRFHLYDTIPLVVTLALVFLVSFLICFQAHRRVVPLITDTALIALAVSIALTEIAWAMQFLPLHYVVQAGVLVCFYYVSFHLISVSYERRLDRRDLVEFGIVGSAALALILSTARWH